MTALQLASGLAGLAVVAGYFGIFHRVIRRSLARGPQGRWPLVLGVGLRQLALAAVLLALWRSGFDGPWLLGGIVAGAALHRLRLVYGWPPASDAAAFTGPSEGEKAPRRLTTADPGDPLTKR